MSEDPVFVLNPCLVLWIWHSHSFIWYRLASSNNFPLFPCLSETTTYCPWMSLGNFSCLRVHHLFRCLRREHDDSQATSIVELLLEGESSVIDCLFWKEREREREDKSLSTTQVSVILRRTVCQETVPLERRVFGKLFRWRHQHGYSFFEVKQKLLPPFLVSRCSFTLLVSRCHSLW